MQPLQLPPVGLPRSPCCRIHLDDLKSITLPLKPNAIVVAERFG